jgi:hypothetical protein
MAHFARRPTGAGGSRGKRHYAFPPPSCQGFPALRAVSAPLSPSPPPSRKTIRLPQVQSTGGLEGHRHSVRPEAGFLASHLPSGSSRLSRLPAHGLDPRVNSCPPDFQNLRSPASFKPPAASAAPNRPVRTIPSPPSIILGRPQHRPSPPARSRLRPFSCRTFPRPAQTVPGGLPRPRPSLLRLDQFRPGILRHPRPRPCLLRLMLSSVRSPSAPSLAPTSHHGPSPPPRHLGQFQAQSRPVPRLQHPHTAFPDPASSALP